MTLRAWRTIRSLGRDSVSDLVRLEATDEASESSLDAYRMVLAPMTFPGVGLLVSRITDGLAELEVAELELAVWRGLFEVVRGLGFALVFVELGSEFELLIVWLAFWRPLLVAVVAVVTLIFGGSG